MSLIPVWLIPVRLVRIAEDGLRRFIELLLVRRPVRIANDDDRKRDQVEQAKRLREPDHKIIVHDQPPAAATGLCAASVSLPSTCRYATSASISVSSPGLPSKVRTLVAAPYRLVTPSA